MRHRPPGADGQTQMSAPSVHTCGIIECMFSHRCAFCGNQTHFTARHGRTFKVQRISRTSTSGERLQAKLSVAATCDACGEYNIATGSMPARSANQGISSFYTAGGELTREAKEMSDVTWAPPSMVQANTEYIPESIAGFYQEAHDAFSIGAHRAVLLLSRSVIEATAKTLNVGGSNLVKKIDNLHEEGHIRSGIKEIAHALRHVGNDIAHGDLADPPNAEDAEDVLKLVRMILDDVYVADAVRADILKRRGKSDD